MKKLIIAATFVLAATLACRAQDIKDFTAFARTSDSLVQAAYYAKDTAAAAKCAGEFAAAYNKLGARDKEENKPYLADVYYNTACTYSLRGDKNTTLSYLERSGFYDYDHLREDHDMDLVRSDPRFVKYLAEAKKRGALYSTDAFKTHYKANISDDEKVAGLSLLWSQARYNFVHFDHANLDWNQLYLDYLPKVKNTASTAAYYKVLETFYAQLKDGHTNVYPPEELARDFYSRPPISTGLVEGRVFVKAVRSDTLQQQGIVPGLEILKIDGQPVKDYAEKNVKPYASSSTPQDMEVREYTYGLLCGPEKTPVVLELKDRHGKVFTRSVPRSGYHDVKFQMPVQYEVIGNIGYLTVNNFESDIIDNMYLNLFDSISHTKGLIIDVRNNGGGSSGIGYLILRTLIDKPIKTSVSKWRKFISQYGEQEEWEVADAGTINPDGKRYYGKPVIVLTGPVTFSAGEDFVVAFDYAKRGKLVGMPTGGSTGQPISFNLPGGGQARVCGKWDSYPDGKEFVGVGIMPDVVVTPTIKDLQAGRDAAKEKAIEMLNGM